MRDGAERIVNLNQEDFVAGVNRITFDRGVDLVIDSLKGKTLDRSFDAIKVLGHVACLGIKSSQQVSAHSLKIVKH